MRSQLVLALFLVAGFQALAQAPAAPPQGLPKDPRAILAAAAPFYDFSDPTLKPFHIKATYQLYDEKGKPEEQGTWDYWHISAKEYRSSWVRADATRTDWHTADGSVHRKESGKPLRYFERNLVSSIFYPLPSKAMLDSGRFKLEAQSVTAGAQTLPCAVTNEQSIGNGRPQAPAFAVVTRYCFDPSTHALLLSALTETGIEYRQIVKVQNHYFPREVAFFAGKVKSFTFLIDMIDDVAEADATLTPAQDAVLVSPPIDQSNGGGPPAASVTAGHLIKKAPPEYPIFAKMNRLQGEVVLAAVISKEGRIKDLEVLASPSPLLTKSALDAVKRWEYAPYLLNGEPVEVETTINVIFTLGQ
jgi:TonB family protein